MVVNNRKSQRGAMPGLAVAAGLALCASLPGRADAQVNKNWVTIVVAAETDTVDPCMAPRATAGTIVMRNIVETLTEKDPASGEVKPLLATSWKQMDDKTWRFTLRQGVSFHDGAPLNGETAATSINRSMNKALTCEVRVKTFSGISITAKAVGEHEVEIAADKPVPIMPTMASAVTLQSPNTPAEFTLVPIGTGPYAFDKWNTGTDILLKRHDKYWGPKPAVEGARYIWRAESSVRAAMVKLGEADLAPNIAPNEATDPKLDRSYLNSETTYLRIDSLPPLNDRRVRLALNYALDRYSMLGSIMPKDALHATQMVVPGVAGHNNELDKMVRPFDPAKAKALLAEAKADGVAIDKQIILLVRPGLYINTNEQMEAIHGMYKAVGLNVKLQSIDGIQGRAYSTKPYPEDREPGLQQSTHDNNLGDPVFSMAFKYACDGPQSKMCSPELDKLIDAASATPSGPERVKKCENIFKIVYEEHVPEVWFYHMVGYARVNPRINFKPSLTTNNEISLKSITFN